MPEEVNNSTTRDVSWQKKLRYWLEWLGVALCVRIIPMLPLALLRLLADIAGWVAYHVDRKGRAVALANLQVAFGKERDLLDRKAIARRSLQMFGRSFLELFWTPRLNASNLHRYLYFEDDDAFKEWCSSDSPPAPIFLTIHFSNFEWASALFALRGYHGCILTQRFKNDRLTPIFRRLRESSGQKAVTQEFSVVRFLKMILRGTPVGILGDLTMKMSQPAVIIWAFGLRMRVTVMHAILHKRTNARIQPFITILQPEGRYIVRLLEPLEFDKNASYQCIAQTCWEKFEPIIRQYPEQWLWCYKHWRYRPVGEANYYPFYAKPSERFERELTDAIRGGFSCEAQSLPGESSRVSPLKF
jgi:lauroyl/myristoyl acyltransferase